MIFYKGRAWENNLSRHRTRTETLLDQRWETPKSVKSVNKNIFFTIKLLEAFKDENVIMPGASSR